MFNEGEGGLITFFDMTETQRFIKRKCGGLDLVSILRELNKSYPKAINIEFNYHGLILSVLNPFLPKKKSGGLQFIELEWELGECIVADFSAQRDYEQIKIARLLGYEANLKQ